MPYQFACRGGYYNQFLFKYRVFLFSLSVRGKPTPLVPALCAFFFTLVNGYMQGRYLTNYLQYDMSWFYDPRFLIGHILFLAGMAINIHSDAVLRSLRKPGDTEYKIPHGMHNNINTVNLEIFIVKIFL